MVENKIKSVVILGSGNVATNLGVALHRKGISVLQVYSRKQSNAVVLAERVNAQAISNLVDLREDAELYITALSDSAIPDVLSSLKPLGGMVIHTSGSTSIDVFNGLGIANYGVFYPFQTFSRAKQVDFSAVPICIEANSPENLTCIRNFGKVLSDNVIEMDSEKRKWLHLTGVFACNFSNHLLALVFKICEEKGIPFEIVKPLVVETVNKAFIGNPANFQTGPAVRNDVVTIQKHVKMLSEFNMDMADIYKMLSLSIQNLRVNGFHKE